MKTRTIILTAVMATAISAQAVTVNDRAAWEIIKFANRMLKVDKQCREKLGIVKPPKDKWFLGCGLAQP